MSPSPEPAGRPKGPQDRPRRPERPAGTPPGSLRPEQLRAEKSKPPVEKAAPYVPPPPVPVERPLAIGHRGRHQVHIENTMEAFRAAYEAGCDMVEFDVQLSRDGVPFIFHDDDGLRLAGRREMVFDLDWSELREWVLPGKQGNPSGYRLPSLEQFLSEFGSRAFYLEMKVPKARAKDEAYWKRLGDACAAMVKAASPRPETFLASFHPPILVHLAKAKAFPTLVGIFEDLERYRLSLDGKAPVDRFSLSWQVYQGYKKSAAPKVTATPSPDRILLWNLKSERDMLAARADGVYGLCADDVEAVVRVCKLEQ